VVIARTDALAPNGWADAIARAKAYRTAGADLVFVDGIRTQDDLATYSRELAEQGIPCLYNGGLVSATEAQQMGFKIQILAGLALGAVWRSANSAMDELLSDGTTKKTGRLVRARPGRRNLERRARRARGLRTRASLRRQCDAGARELRDCHDHRSCTTSPGDVRRARRRPVRL